MLITRTILLGIIPTCLYITCLITLTIEYKKTLCDFICYYLNNHFAKTAVWDIYKSKNNNYCDVI